MSGCSKHHHILNYVNVFKGIRILYCLHCLGHNRNTFTLRTSGVWPCLAADLLLNHFKEKLIRLPVGGICGQGFGFYETLCPCVFALKLILCSHPLWIYLGYQISGTIL